jgi:hypothetical protein
MSTLQLKDAQTSSILAFLSIHNLERDPKCTRIPSVSSIRRDEIPVPRVRPSRPMNALQPLALCPAQVIIETTARAL